MQGWCCGAWLDVGASRCARSEDKALIVKEVRGECKQRGVHEWCCGVGGEPLRLWCCCRPADGVTPPAASQISSVDVESRIRRALLLSARSALKWRGGLKGLAQYCGLLLQVRAWLCTPPWR